MNFLGIFVGFGMLAILFWLLIGLISILAFIFWIMMLVDCVKRKFPESAEKIVWILVLIFLQVLGALIYYFIVKDSGSNKKRN